MGHGLLFSPFLTTLSSALFRQLLAKLELHSPNEIWNQFKTTKVPYLMWLKFGLSQTLSGSSFPSTLIQVLPPPVCEHLKTRVQFSFNMVSWHASCFPTFFCCVTKIRKLDTFPSLSYSHLCDWKTKRRKRLSFCYFGLPAGKQDPADMGFSCNSHSNFLSLLIPRWQISGNVFFSSFVSVVAF